MRVRLPKHKKARIEIIPLIDVIFFCLATFVLYTLTLNRDRAIIVDLPQQVMALDRPRQNDVVTVTVSETGDVFWNADRLSMDAYRIRVSNHLREEPNARILVNGEERAPFGLAVEAMDIARRAGVENVTIVTKPRTVPRS
jgi:biopolymer transport protein ExbD